QNPPRPRLSLRSISPPFPVNRLTACSATMKILCSRQLRMSEEKRARFKQWLESGEARLHPLTFSQRELWETSPAPAADVSNHICCTIRVRGLISEQDCVASIQRGVNRQGGLRGSFLPGKDGPVQLIRTRSEPAVRFRDVPPE